MPQSDIDKDAFDFGLNLKKLRKSRGWTQEEFSKILGVHKDMVSKYENNLKTPSLERIIKICRDPLLFCLLRYGLYNPYLRHLCHHPSRLDIFFVTHHITTIGPG